MCSKCPLGSTNGGQYDHARHHAAAIGADFVIHSLLGERRAVRECNAVLDSRLQDLLKAMIKGDRPMPVDLDDDPALR